MFHMDSYHFCGTTPYHYDSRVPYLLLILIWVKLKLENRNREISLKKVGDLFKLFETSHICMDIMVPQQDNEVDCGLFVIKFVEAILKFPLPNFEDLTTYYFSKVALSSTTVDEYRSHVTLILKEVDRLYKLRQEPEESSNTVEVPMMNNQEETK
jgi:hypothetical protein